MKRLWILAFLIGSMSIAMAQSDRDAFNFSLIDYQGTARSMGAGNAFSSIGGDFTALNTNPAAIGLYKRSEFTFRPMVVSIFGDNTSYYGKKYYTKNANYSMSNASLVISNTIDNSRWKIWQFGFGYNRIMDYNNTFRLEGTASSTNSSSTILDPIVNNAQGTAFSALSGDALLCWETWLMDTVAGTNNLYYSPFSGHSIHQSGLVKTSGGIDEISVTFGGNYNDQLYIGGSIGFPILHYTEQITYKENPADAAALQGISNYTLSSTQEDEGSGINLKLGAIYQPWNFLRLGIGFQTPTYYWNIKDSYNRQMISYYENGQNSDVWSYDNDYNFSLSTPLKANLSASFIVNKRGFIAAEYEFTDYSLSKMYSNDYSFETENEAIGNKYGVCNTIRVGGELNLTSMLSLRLGYNFKSSPYKLQDAPYNATAHYATAGFGIRSKTFFFDMAYVLKYSKDNYWLYTYNNNEAGDITNVTHRVVATVGWKF